MYITASIIIRAFNNEDTIEQAVESALNQNFDQRKFEIVIINDGSKDKTGEILKKYERGTNIVIFNQENKGAIEAANQGFGESRGEYVVLLDGDDTFEDSLLKEEVSALDNNRAVCFVYPNYFERVADEIRIVSVDNVFQTVAVGTMYRKSKLTKVNFFRKVFFAEYDLILRTLELWKSLHIKKPLFTYNRSKKSLTSNFARVHEGLEELKRLHPNNKKDIEKIRSYIIKG